MKKVFVSSTYSDLIPYRDVVQKVIRQARAVAVGIGKRRVYDVVLQVK